MLTWPKLVLWYDQYLIRGVVLSWPKLVLRFEQSLVRGVVLTWPELVLWFEQYFVRGVVLIWPELVLRFEQCLVKGVVLNWPELNSWFERILWTCYSIDENNKWSLIHWRFMEIFAFSGVILSRLFWIWIESKLNYKRCDINLTRIYIC